MVVSEDRGDANGRATRILSRTDGFKGRAVLTKYKLCNTASFHPVNGELYYNSAEQGQFFRFDMEEYYSNPSGYVARKGDELFKVQDSGWAFRIVMHPTGDYAYIMVTNKGCIMRADYNWGLKRFKQPYVVCGEAGQRSWADGIGVNARLNRPYQGVFVKNPEYEAAGKNDIYDYYFTDVDTHSVRILTPEGVVTTFAGRGSPGLNLNADGFVEGEVRLEARFNAPTGIEYDENEKAFYISDTKNRRMRKIALEDMEE